MEGHTHADAIRRASIGLARSDGESGESAKTRITIATRVRRMRRTPLQGCNGWPEGVAGLRSDTAQRRGGGQVCEASRRRTFDSPVPGKALTHLVVLL
jgi:hypothetical protein